MKMISNTENTVRYFQNDEAKKISNDVIQYGIISKGIRDVNSPNGIRYENWKARFIGDACKKSKTLKNKDVIIITKWEITNEVISENQYDYYLIIYEFEMKQKEKGFKDGSIQKKLS